MGHGLTFGPLLRRLNLRVDDHDEARLRNEARDAAVTAGLRRLDRLVVADELPEGVAADIRRSLQARQRRYRSRLAYLEVNPGTLRSAEYQAAAAARRAVINAQHDEYLHWRHTGRLPDSSLRILQNELDHEERTLPIDGADQPSSN